MLGSFYQEPWLFNMKSHQQRRKLLGYQLSKTNNVSHGEEWCSKTASPFQMWTHKCIPVEKPHCQVHSQRISRPTIWQYHDNECSNKCMKVTHKVSDHNLPECYH
jgi:hypothetical protein